MSSRKLRWLGCALVATGGVGLLALTEIMNSAFAYGETPGAAPPGMLPFPNPDVVYAEIMGGSGGPIPRLGFGGDYMADVFKHFLAPNFPSLNFDSPCPAAPCDLHGLVAPDELFPNTGVNSETLATSISQGVDILNLRLHDDMAVLGPGAGIGVFGYSQSAMTISQEMTRLHETDPDAPVNFVLTGDPMNPNGGVFERFEGLNIPSLGLNFNGATPDDLYPTTIYTLEYDGYSDFPRYPINFLSDLNAFAGILNIHGLYPILPDAQYDTAIQLPVSGPTDTTYFMIPVDQLPLATLIQDVAGKPVADLLAPDLQVLVNLGYGPDPSIGWSDSSANVPTQFGLFPSIDSEQFNTIVQALGDGAQKGFNDFIADLSDPSGTTSTGTSTALESVAQLLADPPSISQITEALNGVATAIYSALLPTADIINALVTVIPGYDAELFLDHLDNPIDAIGYPIAADTGLISLAGALELFTINNAVQGIEEALGGLVSS
jgi:hypothetical protein